VAKQLRHNDTNKIEDLMKLFIKENNLTKGLRQVTIEELWKEQMGNGVANYTDKLILKGETLLVYLKSSVLREELTYGKEKIIKMLNDALGEELIKKIRLL
jgi:hypothetical protein